MREVRESSRVINLSWFPFYLLHGNCLRHFDFYVNYENYRVRLRIGRKKLEEKTYKLSKLHSSHDVYHAPPYICIILRYYRGPITHG
jgi:hypothetical protein